MSPLPSSAAPPPFAMGEREFIAILAFTQSLQALAIDMMLPGIGEIARDLGENDPNQRQLIIGVFLIGAGVGAILPGMFADRFGRRPVLLTVLGIFIGMSVACALVQDFTVLLVLRFLQAAGSGGLAVLPMAIIRDRFEGDKMARLQSLIFVIFMVVPMLAPSLGQAVLAVAGWRWIFALIAVFGVMVSVWVYLRLPETLHPDYRQQINLRTIGAIWPPR